MSPRDLVLITGARGYLGGRLLRHLLASDRFGVRAAFHRPGSQAPESRPVQWVAAGTFDDEAQLREACRGTAQIVHLAAPNEVLSAKDPVRAIDITVSGTLRLLQAARAEGARRFVYLSTAHVYGTSLAGEVDETTPAWPVHPYAITHRAAEDFVLAAGSRDFETIVLRLSNAVGAPADLEVDRWTLLVNDLCRQVATTRKIQLRSSGLQWRDFISMADACRAIEHVLTRDKGAIGGVYNVGSGSSDLVIDVVERLRRQCESIYGTKPEVERPAPKEGEPGPRLVYKVSKFLSTGFRLTGDLDAEIGETIRLCQRFVAAAT